MSLDTKYRPKDFAEVIGNEAEIEALQRMLDGKKAKSFLITGPSGCGKTTLARIIAKHLGASALDTKQHNISKQGGIKEARAIIDSCRYAPLSGRSRVIVLNECHKATNEFQNAMLDILEEPPRGTFFILCTTDPVKLIKTIHTRCTPIKLKALTSRELRTLIKSVVRKEGVEKWPDEATELIAKSSDGSARRALVTLSKVIDIKGRSKILAAIPEAAVDNAQTIDLCRALAAKANWETLAGIIKNIDDEPEQVRYSILGYFEAMLLNSKKGNALAVEVIDCFSDSFMYTGRAGLSMCCYLTTKIK